MKKTCDTCLNENRNLFSQQFPSYCSSLNTINASKPKTWWLKLTRIFMMLLAVIILFSGVAFAAEPDKKSFRYIPPVKLPVGVDTGKPVFILTSLYMYRGIKAQVIANMDAETDVLARLIYSEARGVGSKMEQAAVAWCVLNRVDARFNNGTIIGVATARNQFSYSMRSPVKGEFKELAIDVVWRWKAEKAGCVEAGRVLPRDYLYFSGRNGHNWFRKTYRSREYWNWDCKNPYAS